MSRRALLAIVWIAPSALFLAITAVVFAAYRIPPPVRLDDTDRARVIASLRAALAGQPAPSPAIPALALEQPITVTVWSGGRAVVRTSGAAHDLATAVRIVAETWRANPNLRGLADRDAARIQVDVAVGHAPLGDGHWLVEAAGLDAVGEMMAVNPGIEGVGVSIDGDVELLLPHELIAQKLLAVKRPSEAVSELAIGVDVARIRRVLASRVRRPSGIPDEALFRFRTDTFVEPPRALRGTAAPLQLTRGIPAPPTVSAATLRALALSGGRFLVAHLAPTGRYIYEHDLATGQQSDPKRGAYSMPRHAGTTYFLAELYRITKEPWLREPIERAFAHLAELMANGRCARQLPDGTSADCVLDQKDKVATLGSTALAVVALAEYQRATGDTRYLATARKLAAWLLWMQRADGSFRHRYDVTTQRPDEDAQDLYYSGEAALALARMYAITGELHYAYAAGHALDWLVGWYDFFLGAFFYGEEHWTCIAAEAIWPVVARDAYVDFCHGYGAFLRDQQPVAGDHPDEDDLAGSYGVSPFLMPYNTPAGSRTEAMISAYLLGRHHGTPDAAVRAQIRAALAYTVGQMVRPDSDFAVVGPGLGGMPGSPIDRNVRIDFVQHVASSFIRASEWIDDE